MILLMIVRNEADVIQRALDSAAKHGCTDYVILDTGSEDATMDIIDAHRMSGHMLEQRWSNFADARSYVLEMAGRQHPGSYGIMLDADDVITHLDQGPKYTDKNAYQTLIDYANTRYARTNVFRLDAGWSYRGVVHEIPHNDNPHIGNIVGNIKIIGGGVRSNDALKYLHDADLIAKALEIETDQSMRYRYCFYLAQSYRHAKHAGAAIYWYEITYNAQGWSEERYIAALKLGLLTGDNAWYARAAAINPLRREAWAQLGVDAPMCKPDPNWLFVQTDLYV